MKVAIIGTGYVGLVTGTCFSEVGVNVVCVDVDQEKIANLKRGISPIYESGLEDMIRRNIKNKSLSFATELCHVVNNVDVIFIAVGTPPDKDGSADLHYVLEVAREIGRCIDRYTVVVTKSTVPVGTSENVREVIAEELRRRKTEVEFDVASNPEFLKEGAAIKDFMSPDRVVIGVDSYKAKEILARLYKPFMLNSDRLIFTDVASAEMIKYASNAMLATRISFMNELAEVCERVGADVNMVRRGMGADVRIGSKFLYPGCGYGGSCFPKDVRALIQTAKSVGCQLSVLEAVDSVNNHQKHILFRKLSEKLGADLTGKRIAVWGLSFKPETDDMREAPSLVLIDELIRAGAEVAVYDPVAMDECRRRIVGEVDYAEDMYQAAEKADALVLVTEWMQFRMPSWSTLYDTMRQRLIIDGRNIYNRAEVESSGFEYVCIGEK